MLLFAWKPVTGRFAEGTKAAVAGSLLAVTGLTHRQPYGDIFAVTCIKTLAVFFVIAAYYVTGLV